MLGELVERVLLTKQGGSPGVPDTSDAKNSLHCHRLRTRFVIQCDMNTLLDTETRKPRMEYWKAAPEVFKAMLAMETAVRNSGLDPILQELIKLRVSQINGCA